MALIPPAFNGKYFRPSGSDGYPPAVGTLVVWRATRPVIDAANQAMALGVQAWVLGDITHLRKHGDHTGHSYGKTRGRVYATDIMIHSAEPARSRLLAYLRSDADTRWIDFLNFAGSQYNYAGIRVASSGDYHLHLSVNAGYEDVATSAADLVHYVITGQHKPQPKPQAVSKPAAPATNPEEDDDMKLVKIDGLDPVYKTDGLSLTHISRPSYDILMKAGYKLVTYPKGTKLDALIEAFGPLTEETK